MARGFSRARDGHSSGTAVAGRLEQPTRATIRRRICGHLSEEGRMLPLFGLAPGGACPAAHVAMRAVRSYRTVSPLPCGGLFSVALSLGLPPPDVIRHLVSVEPGLSSAMTAAAIRPAGSSAIGVQRHHVNCQIRKTRVVQMPRGFKNHVSGAIYSLTRRNDWGV